MIVENDQTEKAMSLTEACAEMDATLQRVALNLSYEQVIRALANLHGWDLC